MGRLKLFQKILKPVKEKEMKKWIGFLQLNRLLEKEYKGLDKRENRKKKGKLTLSLKIKTQNSS